jgi:hypothetical protein
MAIDEVFETTYIIKFTGKDLECLERTTMACCWTCRDCNAIMPATIYFDTNAGTYVRKFPRCRMLPTTESTK